MTHSSSSRANKGKAARKHGRIAEGVASAILRFKGYRILARNERTAAGEIDIIAKHKKVVVFVEVKSRNTLDSAAYALGLDQQRRIARSAEAYLSRHPNLQACDLRFDVLLLAPGAVPSHIKDAWRPELR